jgi:SAM-dependent methyltransferase
VSVDFYGALAPQYDRMIPWEARLRKEAPWLEAVWARTGARRVLDAACGSGAHVAFIAGQGLEVVGADASASMLDLARERLASIPADERPRLIHVAWEDLPAKLPETYDVVLCLGNSLPYVTDLPALRRGLAGMWACVAPGGVLLLQFKNFVRRRAEADRMLPVTGRREADGAEHLFVRLYDWGPELVDFTILMLSREAGKAWVLHQLTTQLRPWQPDRVIGELCELGARVMQHGSLALDPFSPEMSEDVVLWAAKPKG